MDFLKRNTGRVVVGALVLMIGAYAYLFSPPAHFPTGSIFVVAKGTSLSEVAQGLSGAHIVEHPGVLELLLRMTGASNRIQAGPYLFSAPENVVVVAYRLIAGDSGLPPVRITFPEGTTVRDMALKVAEAFPLLRADDFIALGKPQEGYLFPDTYFFQADATIDSILATMRKNFDAKILALSSDIQASGHSLSDTVVMASLVEKEARTTENRRLVAGVLWNRIALGMPLQADAVFGYIYDRDTYSPSFADLTVKSPYNVYLHTGLPPGPINNPGLDALLAALHPTKTNYVYYLTDKNGVMHYAVTYTTHQANQNKYLR